MNIVYTQRGEGMVETDVPLLYGLKQRYGYILLLHFTRTSHAIVIVINFLILHLEDGFQGPLRFAIYLFWRGAVKKVLKGSSTFY